MREKKCKEGIPAGGPGRGPERKRARKRKIRRGKKTFLGKEGNKSRLEGASVPGDQEKRVGASCIFVKTWGRKAVKKKNNRSHGDDWKTKKG